MEKATRYVGLDVHADTIAVAVAESGRGGEVRSLGVIPNRPEDVRKLVRKLGGPAGLRVCYEAGPTGYALYWQLVKLNVECEVIAPSLVPNKPGDRVKTDRRDAIKLARCYRADELTAVWVPDPAHEALRDLVRAREAAIKDQLRARHRLSKLLLRAGRRPPENVKRWGTTYMAWVRVHRFEHAAKQTTFDDYLSEIDHVAERIRRFEQAIEEALNVASPATRAVVEALQALHGVAKITAATVAVEVGNFSRFDNPKQLMAWCGMTPSEYSTGGPKRQRRGAITKSGNARVRRVLFEAAWGYRRRATSGAAARRRRRELPPHVNDIAAKAQHRLCRRYAALVARGKPSTKAVAAVGRELLGFVWAIAVHVEKGHEAAQPQTLAA